MDEILGMFQGLYSGFGIAFSLINLTFALIGAVLGTVVGILPGLGPAATISLLLPVSFKIGSPVTSIIMMAGIFYGAMYGGSTTSILVNIPGEAASVVTCIDGYQMALKGRAGPALGIAAIGSFVAGTIGVLGLTFVAPPLAELALKFGPPEYFSLTLFGLLMATLLGEGSILKGLIMVVMGLLLGSVGLDPISGAIRFTWGLHMLQEGIDFVTLAMGMFGMGEIFYNLEKELKTELVTRKVAHLWPTLKDWADSKWAVIRGSFIGFFIGILPGGGAVISSLVSYAVEKKVSKTPEEFGKGAIQGVAGPESANNSAASASFIPLLTLGIPGNAAIAMIFAALLIQGVQPGPFLITERPDIFWGVVASMYIGNVMLLILNLPMVGLWVQLLRVPYAILAPIIVLFCCVGVYSIRNTVFDIYVMGIFGVIGYILRKVNLEPGPMILAFVLGPIMERAIRQALLISAGSPLIFFTRPISGTLMGLLILFIVLQVFIVLRKKKTSNHT
ncbi:MAG TPA: tripartite tricarboxylate transporter permease [Thermodesulfobacteriota bacterium]|nr:tripartite tricarboxylate transporter permease [Thermodesulfobacteriota bacterium]